MELSELTAQECYLPIVEAAFHEPKKKLSLLLRERWNTVDELGDD